LIKPEVGLFHLTIMIRARKMRKLKRKQKKTLRKKLTINKPVIPVKELRSLTGTISLGKEKDTINVFIPFNSLSANFSLNPDRPVYEIIDNTAFDQSLKEVENGTKNIF
jgi:hypothetical protein